MFIKVDRNGNIKAKATRVINPDNWVAVDKFEQDISEVYFAEGLVVQRRRHAITVAGNTISNIAAGTRYRIYYAGKPKAGIVNDGVLTVVPDRPDITAKIMLKHVEYMPATVEINL